MDNPRIVNHPFFTEDGLDTKYNKMIKFDNHEDIIQAKYLYPSKSEIKCDNQRLYEKNEIDKLNKYLKYSFNSHTIAVSSNIETKDKYLIIGERGGLSIDNGEYYCSVNGQSEFRDEAVSFYRNSVFEDLPSMDYNSLSRVDLNQEIKREAIAELGIFSFNAGWKYYGVSYLSINNFMNNCENRITLEASARVHSRRMHFNVLTFNTTSLYFHDIVKNRENATENFENSKIKGLRTIIYKDETNRRNERLISLYKWISQNKSNVFLILFLITFIINKNNGLKLSVEYFIDILLLLIYILIIVHTWVQNKSIRKLKISRCFLATDFDSQTLSMKFVFDHLSLKMKEKKKKEKLHAIFRIMYALYFLDKKNSL